MRRAVTASTAAALVAVALLTGGCGGRLGATDPVATNAAATDPAVTDPVATDPVVTDLATPTGIEADVANIEAVLAETDTLLASIEAEIAQDAP